MKKCTTCEKHKEESEFFKKRNGLESFCKQCRKEKTQNRINSDPEKYKKFCSDRSKKRWKNEDYKKSIKNWREKNKEKIAKQCREYLDKNKDYLYSKQKEWRTINKNIISESENKYKENNPLKLACRSYVRTAIKNGNITNPNKCNKCMKECKPEAHHKDYTKPLEIIWLCRTCHGHEHRKK